MIVHPLFEIVRVPGVVTTIHTLENIKIKSHMTPFDKLRANAY
jgi:hypothetical protein